MSRSDLIDVAAELIGETEKAWKISDGTQEAWLPKSQCEHDAETSIFTMPEWLAKEKGAHLMSIVPTYYDITRDERRPVTQDWIDDMQKILFALYLPPQRELLDPSPTGEFNFRLAIYPNRHRPGEVFVARDMPIQPYHGVWGLSGEPIFPAVPNTPYSLGMSINERFAREIVSCWNYKART